MEKEFEKRSMTQAEDKYTFSQSDQIYNQCGLIGHLRADMDTDGNGFFSTWNDWRKDLKTDEFKAELDEVINSLREEGDILHAQTNERTGRQAKSSLRRLLQRPRDYERP